MANVPTTEDFKKEKAIALEKFNAAWKAFTEAKFTASYLDDLTKPVLADAFLNTADGPVEKRKMEAYNSRLYREHIIKLNEARKKANVEYYGLQEAGHDIGLLQSDYKWRERVLSAGG